MDPTNSLPRSQQSAIYSILRQTNPIHSLPSCIFKTHHFILPPTPKSLKRRLPYTGRSQWPLTCWECEFEFRRRHGCLPLLNVVCFQVQADPSSRGVLPSVVRLSVISKPQQWWGPGPLGLSSHEKNNNNKLHAELATINYTHFSLLHACHMPCQSQSQSLHPNNIWHRVKSLSFSSSNSL